MKRVLYIFVCYCLICNFAHAQAVISQEIDDINLNFIGIDNKNYNDLWANMSLYDAMQALDKTAEIAVSPYNIEILTKMLIATGEPKNNDKSSLFLHRINQLVKLGKLNEAIKLLDMISDNFWTPEVATTHTNILFLQEKNNTVCMNASELLNKYKTRYFEEVYNFCLLLHDKKNQLLVGLTLMEEQYKDTSLFQQIASENLNKKDITPNKNISGFDFALYNYANINIEKELSQSNNLWALKKIADRDIDTAKIAIDFGIIDPEEINKNILKQIKPVFTIEKYTEMLEQSWNNKQFYLVPSLYKSNLKSITITQENMKYASTIIKSLLVLQEYTLAFEWYKKAEFLANKDATNRKTAVLFSPIFKLLYNYGPSNNITINKYKLLKDTSGFDVHQTLQEEKIIANILAGDMEIANLEIASSMHQKGKLLITCLQELAKNHLVIDEVYIALIKAGFTQEAKTLAIEVLAKHVNYGE